MMKTDVYVEARYGANGIDPDQYERFERRLGAALGEVAPTSVPPVSSLRVPDLVARIGGVCAALQYYQFWLYIIDKVLYLTKCFHEFIVASTRLKRYVKLGACRCAFAYLTC